MNPEKSGVKNFMYETSCMKLRFALLSGCAGVPARWGNFV